MMKMKTALFVGRFNPLHKGHEHAMKSLIKKFRLVIVIGSTNKRDRNNIFSFKQRKKMIDAVLKKYKNRYRIIAIADVMSDKKWVKSILKKAKFDVVVTRNAWTKRCFKGFRIVEQKLFKPKIYNATRIRKLIKDKKNWEAYVPKEVVKIIKKS